MLSQCDRRSSHHQTSRAYILKGGLHGLCQTSARPYAAALLAGLLLKVLRDGLQEWQRRRGNHGDGICVACAQPLVHDAWCAIVEDWVQALCDVALALGEVAEEVIKTRMAASYQVISPSPLEPPP